MAAAKIYQNRRGSDPAAYSMPSIDKRAASPSPATSRSMIPSKGFLHPGRLIQEVISPPPRIMRDGRIKPP